MNHKELKHVWHYCFHTIHNKYLTRILEGLNLNVKRLSRAKLICPYIKETCLVCRIFQRHSLSSDSASGYSFFHLTNDSLWLQYRLSHTLFKYSIINNCVWEKKAQGLFSFLWKNLNDLLHVAMSIKYDRQAKFIRTCLYYK